MITQTFLDLSCIRDPRFPVRSGKEHLVFNSDCDDLPFTIFPEMPGYKTLMGMIRLGIKSTRCELKWKFLNNKYNRCEGIEFLHDFVKYVQNTLKMR